MSGRDFSQMSMLDLFRLEAEGQGQTLTDGLLALEQTPTAPAPLESCMRAAHSLKGAARLVDIGAGVALAHAMEDCFVAAQKGRIVLEREGVDELLKGVDLLIGLASSPAAPAEADGALPPEIAACIATLEALTAGRFKPAPAPEVAPAAPEPAPAPEPAAPPVMDAAPAPSREREVESADRMLRVTAENVDRLISLAGESLVESRWLSPFGNALRRIKRMQGQCSDALAALNQDIARGAVSERTRLNLADAQIRLAECQSVLLQNLAELDLSERRSANLSRRLYDAALACRMRPFSDGAQGLPRMVRDLARSLGKQAQLDIVGADTEVDRDILERLDAPLCHLLRNAVDHGLETPDERRAAGKGPTGRITVEARHSGGALQIIVSDNGRGFDVEAIRDQVVQRWLTDAGTAAELSDAELYEFLFLPGFSLKEEVTEISGRGVGLDAVQDLVRQMRGSVRVSSTRGAGARFQLDLPLTLSVARTLVVDIGGNPYALPLADIERAIQLKGDAIEELQGRQHFLFEGRNIALVSARQLLADGDTQITGETIPVVLITDHTDTFGLAVDKFIGHYDLVVQPLDPRLGKLQDVSAGALMPDGTPVLILDVEDMARSIERLTSANRMSKLRRERANPTQHKRKRVLVVDDSLTVRELERKLLARSGYEVETAVDGMDGWNAVRNGDFSLVVSDIDMPRMDGIELLTLIRADQRLKSLPVMIVSYRDREEDRRRGLDAGADFYLAKSSFQDDRLVHAVLDLIGGPIG